MFCERLRQSRISAGLSQKELAARIFISQQAYAKYELGTSSPNPETLAKIAEQLNISVDYLLGRDSVDTYEKREPGTQTDAELSELNSIISRLSDGNRAKLRELAQLYLDSEQRKEENG